MATNDRKDTKARAIGKGREYIRAILQSSKCADCPETDWRVLDFDHLPSYQKGAAVTRLVNDGYSVKRIQEEIDKTEIRCVRCHRLKTFERGGYWRNA